MTEPNYPINSMEALAQIIYKHTWSLVSAGLGLVSVTVATGSACK